MNSSMFHFKNFVSSSHEELNDGELKLASLVINNFSEIEKKGTAAGSRARYVSSIHTSNTFVPAVKEPLAAIDDSSRLVKLSSIEIEGFRGFIGKETFDLSKKYNFLYGPNGSGKSSFCEALELSLTGKISEAESKNFTVKKYVKNMYTTNSSVLLKVEDTQGEVAPLANAQTNNDFIFIERNRIEGFARVSSYTTGAQQQRLSMLFGLERFTNFCNGFSDSISNYIDSNNPVYDKNKGLALRLEASYSNKKIKIDEQNGLNKNKEILLMRYPNCKLASDLITYLDPQNGLIKKKQDGFYKYKNIKLNNLTPLDTLLKDLSSIADFLVEYERLTKEINVSSSKVVFINLYDSIQAIERLEDVSKNSCPACDTPLIDVKSNPFQKSKEQLLLLKELASKQQSQKSLQRNIENYSTSCNQQLKGLGLTSLIDSTLNQTTEGSVFLNTSASLANSYATTIAKMQDLELENSNNAPLMSEIDNLQRELKVLNDNLAEANQLTALFRKNHLDLKLIDKEIKQTEAAILTLVEKLKLEQQQLEKNQQFITDYTSFVRKLKLYNLELPSVLSQSLSNTVLELYNLINKHPYDHEVLVSLSLPKNANEIIEI
jgi:AAA15 family ATPase/GTPase